MAGSAPAPSIDHFSKTWAEATVKFRSAAQDAGARLETIPLPHLNPGSADLGPPLCIDIAVFEAKNSSSKTSKVLLYTAGQHGVEGFAGSAIMVDLCARIDPSSLSDGEKIIFVHVMNPFGMSEWRRWNENNVDINRNNGISELEFMERKENPDPTYVKYGNFINPKQRVSFCDCFTPRLLCLIAREGFNSGKQALAGGQSHDPAGLFFGGVEWQETPKLVFSHLAKEGVHEGNKDMESFFHVDIHTGVGPYKHDSLLAENCFLPQLEKLFGSKGHLKSNWHIDGIGDWVKSYDGSNESDAEGETKQEGIDIKISTTSGEAASKEAKEGVAYTAKGHIGGGLFYKTAPPQMYKEDQDGKKRYVNTSKWCSVTQEFGTLKGTKIFELLRKENAMTQEILRKASEEDRVNQPSLRTMPERVAVFDAFCPGDPSWRHFVMNRGREVFEVVRQHVFQAK